MYVCVFVFLSMLFGGNCYGEYRVDPAVEAGSQEISVPAAAAGGATPPMNALWLVHKAEYCYEQLHNSVESYRLSRLAYGMDPFNEAGLLLYIASMLDLNIKTELFYLGKCALCGCVCVYVTCGG